MRGYYTEPVRKWFGKDWSPKVDWTPTKQRATRSSADGGNFNVKPHHVRPINLYPKRPK